MSMLQKLLDLGIPESIIDKAFLAGLTSVSGSATIRIACPCGDSKDIKMASVLRTVRRTGSYQCVSCAMKKKHQDPAYQKSHSAGCVQSWTPEKREKQSEISKGLWSDPDFAGKVTDSSTQAWSSPEKREEASVRTVALWEDPAHRARYEALWADADWRKEDSERIKALWETPEYRAKQEAFKASEEHRSLQSDLAKKRWEDPEYRQLIIDSQKELWSDPEIRKIMSERITELWKDPSYLEKQRLAALDPELIRMRSENAKKQWGDLDIRQAISDGIKKIWGDPDYRKRASLISKKQWENTSYREKVATGLAQYATGAKDSILERTAQTLLSALGVPYVRHHVVSHFEFDLFIPGADLLIECNGEYWHSKRRDRDAGKFTYINEYFPQYRILYLWERDFLNPGLVRQKLTTELFGGEAPSIGQTDFAFDDISVRPLDAKENLPNSYYSAPEEFLQSFHYAGYGRSAKVVYGAYVGDTLVAVCKFSPSVRQEVATSMGLSPKNVLELDRFCIHPGYQKKNLASWFLSRCSKLVFSSFPAIHSLVSFSDKTFGHSGSIYVASGWAFQHEVRPDYHYLNPDGFVVHKKTLYDHARRNSQTESDYAAKHGHVKVFGREKLKFSLRRP